MYFNGIKSTFDGIPKTHFDILTFIIYILYTLIIID